jgi:hypothetical protein
MLWCTWEGLLSSHSSFFAGMFQIDRELSLETSPENLHCPYIDMELFNLTQSILICCVAIFMESTGFSALSMFSNLESFSC